MAAATRESDVSLPDGVRGTFTAGAETRGPCAVFLHGFGGHRDEVGGLFKTLAQRLAAAGVASLRFDFPGNGKSDGDFGDTTIPLYARAAIEALRYARSAEGTDPDALALLGYSFGGAVAAACLKNDPMRVRALTLWAPITRPAIDMVESLGAARAEEAARTGATHLDWGDRKIALKHAYFDTLSSVEPLEVLAAYHGAVLVIAGSRDRLAKYVRQIGAAAKNARRCETLVIEGADHFFGAGVPGSGYTETLLATTTDFFVSSLKH